MKSSLTARIATALIVFAIIFGIATVIPHLFISAVIPRIATTQALELGLALAAIIILGRGRFADYGFRWPRPERPWTEAVLHWIPTGLLAIALGAVATLAVLLTGAHGNPLLKKLNLPEIILFVWIFSSTIEEIFTRGFLQSHIALGIPVDPSSRPPRIDLPTWISAAAFASMHLVLLASGAGLKTIVIILLFTFSVGLLAGHQRARTGSLIPAIGVHLLANVGGVVGGIIYMLIRVITGHGIPGQ